MKYLIHILRSFINDHFHLKTYLFTALFLIFIISLNYSFDLEDYLIQKFQGSPNLFLFFFLGTGTPYLITVLIVYVCHQKIEISKQFWIDFGLIFAIFSLYRSLYFRYFSQPFHSIDVLNRFWFRNVGNIEQIVLVLTFCSILYYFRDKKEIGHFYGIKRKNVNFRPYFYMLGIMTILVFGASFLESFKESYPIAKRINYHEVGAILNISEWTSIAIFESFYLSSFLGIELIFRGLLVYIMSKHLGKHFILPMVVSYAVVHFGKPLGETIGSIFGGYILGILAYRTENIWGGIFIHIGVAFLMELFAFLQL